MTKERFSTLWQQCPKGKKVIDPLPVYEQLIRLYSEPQRHYHTLNHLKHCLGQFDRASDHMDDPTAVEIALWFHDAIYDPHASDNELKSAELFLQLTEDALEADFSRKVYALIMITMHQQPPQTLDEKFIVDIDLSSFALPWEEFKQDSQAVREEYAHVKDEDFFPNQLTFLRSLLDRPRFYVTDFFYACCETSARENLQRHLSDLEAQGRI